MVEDAMSLQFALFQVMRALDDHAINPKRAALKLYALQIASSNLKRLQQEIEYEPSADPARQKSLVELLLDQFQIPKEEWDHAEYEGELRGPGFRPGVANAGPRPAPHQTSPTDGRFDIEAVAEDMQPPHGPSHCIL